ncbi:MAG: deoxyribonuclease IV [Parcubacteria group bacterium Gr01-1014_38]|nr:MAG: deoxyribonuclease IV [Parcubacteria group bacterium Gr01-1014_38]
MTTPRIGLHISGAGGLADAPLRAKALGCECFQFFSRSPRGGGAPPISAETAKLFRSRCKTWKLESYIHAPYYINFASSNNRVSFGSVSAVREELERGTLLGATYVMTHLGSASDLGENAALRQAIDRITAIFDPKKGGPYATQLLIEISAGAGGIIGDTFEHLAFILKGVGRPDLGICLDTCHLFASGYDLRTPTAISATMRAFKKHIPLSRFQLVHANDSARDFGEHKDRHTDIGDGRLGVDTFRFLLRHRDFRGRNFVLETPGADARRRNDVALLKKLRG